MSDFQIRGRLGTEIRRRVGEQGGGSAPPPPEVVKYVHKFLASGR